MSALVPVHGGDLAHAKFLVRDAVEPGLDWLDLSTGINPAAYPVGQIPEEIWNRLPDAELSAGLLDVARGYYQVGEGASIVAASGSQALLQILPRVCGAKTVQIVGPTYGGHQTNWQNFGCDVEQIDGVENADARKVVVLVRPNNPSGTVEERDAVLALARAMKQAGGMLIIDEAFCDCSPDHSLVPHMGNLPILVLKSVGKFFGLAGMRLGFAIGAPEIIVRIRTQLGDWPVSGPALYAGTIALGDANWQQDMRAELRQKRARLEEALGVIGGRVVGATSLFALLDTRHAERLFVHLLRHHIYVRAFDYDQNWLRIGLPKTSADEARLAQALADFGDV